MTEYLPQDMKNQEIILKFHERREEARKWSSFGAPLAIEWSKLANSSRVFKA